MCGDMIEKGDFSYKKMEGEERDSLILGVLKRIHGDDLPSAGQQRLTAWERGWQENLDDLVATNYDLNALIPRYFKKQAPARLDLEYIAPLGDNFIFNYTDVYRTWVFKKFLGEAKNIYEFGCGSACNLAHLASLFPEKSFFGMDWATPSQEIIKALKNRFGWDINGSRFDFFNPPDDFEILSDSAVLTFGALEQVGSEHGAFIDFLLDKKPSICVNVECLYELYEPDNLVAYLAMAYHKKRNYLSGYLTRLRQLESSGKIEIVATHRHRFGNLYDDPLSYVVWKVR